MQAELKLEEFEIAYSGLSGVSAVTAELSKKAGTHVLARGLCGSSRALLLASVFARTGKHLLVVAEDAEEAGYLANDLEKLSLNGGQRSKVKGQRESEAIVPLEGKERSKVERQEARDKKVYLFPATHRIRQKGQDESYTIQRTEVLTRLDETSRGSKVKGRDPPRPSLKGREIGDERRGDNRDVSGGSE